MMSSRRYDHQNDNNDNDNDHSTYSTHHHNILECVFPSSHLSRGSDNVNNDDIYDALGGRWLSWEGLQDPTVRASLAMMNRHWWDQWLRHEEQQQQPQHPASDSLMIHRRMLVRHVGMVQDMLDPEYYETSSSWPSPHATTTSTWAERQPLVVVPLPFGRYHRRIGGRNSMNHPPPPLPGASAVGSAVVIPESPPSSSNSSTTNLPMYPTKKRRHDDNNNDDGPIRNDPDNNQMNVDDNVKSSFRGSDTVSPRMDSRPTRRSKSFHCPSSPPPVCHQENNNDNDNEDGSSSMMILGPDTSDSDWWPRGCMESDPNDLPVLAKLYYDEYKNNNDNNKKTNIDSNIDSNIDRTMEDPQQPQEPLKLNDIVECIGIVSSASLEAEADAGDGGGDNDYVYDDRLPLPPHSRLPRLHVLYYRKLSLEDLVIGQDDESDGGGGGGEERVEVKEEVTANDDHDRTMYRGTMMIPLPTESSSTRTHSSYPQDMSPLQVWTNAFGPTVEDSSVWQALFLTLISQAERTPQEGMMHRTLQQQALGCVSLQLQVGNHQDENSPSSSSSSADRLFDELIGFLRLVSPVVASVNLVKDSAVLVQGGPRKEQGRLLPTLWQLPKGATLVIRYDDPEEVGEDTTMTTTTTMMAVVDDDDNVDRAGRRRDNVNQHALLDELLSQHRISYSFEGGVKIPFEADYRIIVVTNNKTRQGLLPCALCCTMNDDDHGGGMEDNSASGRFQLDDPMQVQQLKQALSKARSSVGSGGNNLRLPRNVLEQAQQDFLERRGHGRQGKDGNPKETDLDHRRGAWNRPQDVPKEEDFHRWLTLTRLFARARGSTNEANPADWESALRLDDTLRGQQY